MKKIETHIVPPLEKEVRLSDYTPGKFESVSSKKGMKKTIEKGLVKVNDFMGRTSTYIRGGETIELYVGKPPKEKPDVNVKIEVVYEDEYLAIISKPPGIVVSGNKKWTIENALPKHLNRSDEADALPYPEPIHRLDHPTSGALLIGKTRNTVAALNKLFENRQIVKTYHAIILGSIEAKGELNSEIKGKSAVSKFKVLEAVDSEKFEKLSLVELQPTTGRRHQLRIHLSEHGHPILGDSKYFKKGLVLKGYGLYLHASGLSFVHPVTNESVDVSIPLPDKFVKIFPNVTIS